MGRVAKYKKVKSFDPYSKKNRGNVDLQQVGVWGLGDNGRKAKKRSKKAERMHAKKSRNINSKTNPKKKLFDDGGFDVPPTEKDEFNMADLMGSIKRQKVETKDILGSDISSMTNANPVTSIERTSTPNNKNEMGESYDKIVTSTGNVANIPKTDQDESRVTRLLRLDKQEERRSEKEKQLSHERIEGESKRAFGKRVRAETRQIIKQSTTTKNHDKIQRKKEFLTNKKKKRKGGGSYSYSDEVDDEDTYGNVSYNSKDARGKESLLANEPVRFGEQAERPPTFRQIPRGAKSKSNTTQAAKSVKTESMSDHQIESERDTMELMRRRVQAQYRALKSLRKDAGDFHL